MAVELLLIDMLEHQGIQILVDIRRHFVRNAKRNGQAEKCEGFLSGRQRPEKHVGVGEEIQRCTRVLVELLERVTTD